MTCEKLRATGFGDIAGGYAEYVRVGAHETFLLPDNLSSSDGALVEPLAVGLHAVEHARIPAGEDVLVIGAGPVGLAVSMWARHFGAREVVVSDLVEGRREMAGKMGATLGVDPAVEDVSEAFERATGHAPRVIFECVGVPGLIQQCISLAPRDAKLVIAGICMRAHRARRAARRLRGAASAEGPVQGDRRALIRAPRACRVRRPRSDEGRDPCARAAAPDSRRRHR